MLNSRQFETAERIHGAGVDAFFKGAPKVPAPWPSAGRTKSGSPYKREVLDRALSGPPKMESVDPRYLHATQPSVVLEHARYYSGDEYQTTGRTARDQDNNTNQVPRIYARPDGRMDILSGHHRALGALVNGRQFEAHVIRETD